MDLPGRFKRIPDTRRAEGRDLCGLAKPFKNGKPSRCCYVTAKFSIFETDLRTQTPLSFIGDLRAAFVVAQAGSRLCGRANLESHCRLVASKIPFPEGLQYFGWIARRQWDFSLVGSPKEKERELTGWPLIPQDRFLREFQKGFFPFGQGLGGGSPRGKGWSKMPAPFAGSLDQGEGPRSKTPFLGAFPLKSASK